MDNYGTDITSSFTDVPTNTIYYKNSYLESDDRVLEVKYYGDDKENKIIGIIRIVKDEDGKEILFKDDLRSPEGVLGWVDITTKLGFIRMRGNMTIYYKIINGEGKYEI